MRPLQSLEQARVGETVAFVYFGGSTPAGGNRSVTITDMLEDRIIGTDNHKSETRSYLFVHALEVSVTKERYILPIAEAVCESVAPVVPTGLRHITEDVSFVDVQGELHDAINELTIEELADVARDFGGHDTCEANSSTGLITLGDYKPEPRFEGIDNGLLVFNQEGEELKIRLPIRDGNYVYVDDLAVTPDELAATLISHLAY